MTDVHSHRMLLQVAEFAAQAHQHQRRKGSSSRPYVNHLIEVSRAIADTGASLEVLCAAILHDVVEDTPVTAAQVRAHFGDAIADLVEEVTDDRSLPREERKQLQITHAAHLSAGACLIKLADKTSNVIDLARDPPPSWTRERMLAYISWSEQVVHALPYQEPSLYAQFMRACEEARRTLAAADR